MTYDPVIEQVTYRSDKSEGPTSGTERVDPLGFLARLVTHIPDPGQVMQRYYGWYASRTRGLRQRLALAPSGAEAAMPSWSLPTGPSGRPGSAGQRCSAGSLKSIRSAAPSATG